MTICEWRGVNDEWCNKASPQDLQNLELFHLPNSKLKTQNSKLSSPSPYDRWNRRASID